MGSPHVALSCPVLPVFSGNTLEMNTNVKLKQTPEFARYSGGGDGHGTSCEFGKLGPLNKDLNGNISQGITLKYLERL